MRKELDSSQKIQKKKFNYKIGVAAVIIVIIIAGVLGYLYLSRPTQPTTLPTVTLNGAGATFPYPVLSVMITNYQKTQTKLNLTINYQAIGSGGGISALEGKTVDFAASDIPLGPSDMAKAPGVLHIPETIGCVTLAYNLPGIPTGLHLTAKVIADIFAGNVTMWNDPEIQQLNPNLTLPAKSIITVHRSDGSGTTYIFTGYLSTSSPAWAKEIGQGKTVAWPMGLGANGNAAVAGVIQGTQYTIGYVELAYAIQNNMPVAAIQNPAGNWILPSLNSTQLAVQSAALSGLPAGDQNWTKVSLINAPDSQAYPIVAFTYLLVYQELNVVPGMTQAKATALVQFLWWVVNDGQQYSNGLAYAKLPANVVAIDEASIQSITFNGQHLPTS
jgi:phosphate transport system substrate-binding protein